MAGTKGRALTPEKLAELGYDPEDRIRATFGGRANKDE